MEKIKIDEAMVISSRIRFARNLKGYVFESKMTDADREKLRLSVREAVKSFREEEFDYLEMEQVTNIQAGSMMEEHLISPAFASCKKGSALLLGRSKQLSIMINEEDHLRLQAMGNGFCLKGLYDRLDRLDDRLEETFGYAFDEKLGYLTTCPTNLGTGMRASVMLHLPAMTASGMMNRLINSVSPLGITVRGMYGEGTQASGCLYQVSNQVSLGIGEEDILELLTKVTAQICHSEAAVREKLLKDPAWQDEIFRAYGILRYARILSSAEFAALFSKIRLGAEAGLLSLNRSALDRLFMHSQPYSLMLSGGGSLEAGQRDVKRAELVREALSKEE